MPNIVVLACSVGDGRMVDRAAEYRRNAEACEELARTTIDPAIGE
jgi:hypothetical protein